MAGRISSAQLLIAIGNEPAIKISNGMPLKALSTPAGFTACLMLQFQPMGPPVSSFPAAADGGRGLRALAPPGDGIRIA
jgi:hypothetical protein